MSLEKVIIAAVAENGVIGKDGDIPWHIPEDLKRFKRLTTGNPVVMGRKTFESLPEEYRPLPGRTNIVLTLSGVKADVEEAESLDEAWMKADELSDKAFIIGGESVYRQCLDEADRIEITEIHEEYDGDSFFPEVDWSRWEEESRDKRSGFDFVRFERS